MKSLTITILIFTASTFFACKSKPKIIVEDTSQAINHTIQSDSSHALVSKNSASTNDAHEVIAMEILQAERYTYLKVKENNEVFWIATVKFEPKIGNKYLYSGGLLKTNFESLEHKRVFDKIYLVSNIIDASAHPGSNTEQRSASTSFNTNESASVATDAIKLNELLKNREKYSGKTVIVYGKCVKVNYGIMNKNWVHIQDGTKKDGKVCEITITTTENIPMGVSVAFEGKIVLNKDFGSGYKYDILVEDAKLK